MLWRCEREGEQQTVVKKQEVDEGEEEGKNEGKQQ